MLPAPFDSIAIVAAAIAAVGAVFTFFARMVRTTWRINRAIGVDAQGKTPIDRLEEKVDDIGGRVQRVEYQLHPNGGGSLVDKVNQVDRAVIELQAQNEIVLSMLNTLVDGHTRTVATTKNSDRVPAPEVKPRLRKTTSKSTTVRK